MNTVEHETRENESNDFATLIEQTKQLQEAVTQLQVNVQKLKSNMVSKI